MKNFNEEATIIVEGDNIVDMGVLTVSSSAADAVVGMALNQYNDPIDSAVREIISNALDANKSKNPILVELGKGLNDIAYFKVQDFGEGMNPKQWKDHYMCLMNSSRNDDSTANGGWGIGRLTPLNFVDNYRVITCSEGIKYTYLVVKSYNKINFNLLSEDETNDPSGTTILIELENRYINEIHKSICRYAYHFKNIYYKVSSALDIKESEIYSDIINNEKNDIEFESFKVVESKRFTPNQFSILLGDVLYPFNVPHNHIGYKLRKLISNYNIIIKFPINSLKPLASREGINWEQSPNQSFEDIYEKFLKDSELLKKEILNKNHNSYEDVKKSLYFDFKNSSSNLVLKPLQENILSIKYNNVTYNSKNGLGDKIYQLEKFCSNKISDKKLNNKTDKLGDIPSYIKILDALTHNKNIVFLNCKKQQLSDSDKYTYRDYYTLPKITDVATFVKEAFEYFEDNLFENSSYYNIDKSYKSLLKVILTDFINNITVLEKGIRPKRTIVKKVVVKNIHLTLRTLNYDGALSKELFYSALQNEFNKGGFNKIIYFTHFNKKGLEDVKQIYKDLNTYYTSRIFSPNQVAVVSQEVYKQIKNDSNFITWDDFLKDNVENEKFLKLVKAMYIKETVLSKNTFLNDMTYLNFIKVDNEHFQTLFDRFEIIKDLYLSQSDNITKSSKLYKDYFYLLPDNFKTEIESFNTFINENPFLIADYNEWRGKTRLTHNNYEQLIKSYYKKA